MWPTGQCSWSVGVMNSYITPEMQKRNRENGTLSYPYRVPKFSSLGTSMAVAGFCWTAYCVASACDGGHRLTGLYVRRAKWTTWRAESEARKKVCAISSCPQRCNTASTAPCVPFEEPDTSCNPPRSAMLGIADQPDLCSSQVGLPTSASRTILRPPGAAGGQQKGAVSVHSRPRVFLAPRTGLQSSTTSCGLRLHLQFRPDPTRRRTLAAAPAIRRVPASIQRGRPFSMTIVTCPNPTPHAIRSTSLTTLAIISLSMIGIVARMFSRVNAAVFLRTL